MNTVLQWSVTTVEPKMGHKKLSCPEWKEFQEYKAKKEDAANSIVGDWLFWSQKEEWKQENETLLTTKREEKEAIKKESKATAEIEAIDFTRDESQE